MPCLDMSKHFLSKIMTTSASLGIISRQVRFLEYQIEGKKKKIMVFIKNYAPQANFFFSNMFSSPRKSFSLTKPHQNSVIKMDFSTHQNPACAEFCGIPQGGEQTFPGELLKYIYLVTFFFFFIIPVN